MALDTAAIATDGCLTATVTVRNTGQRAGIEVVQLYLSDDWAEVARPERQLIGYARVELAPDQAARVSFSVHAERTAFSGVDRDTRIVEPGMFTLRAASSSAAEGLQARFEITGQVRRVGLDRVLTTPVAVVPE
jgi:beta-glucosidase